MAANKLIEFKTNDIRNQTWRFQSANVSAIFTQDYLPIDDSDQVQLLEGMFEFTMTWANGNSYIATYRTAPERDLALATFLKLLDVNTTLPVPEVGTVQ